MQKYGSRPMPTPRKSKLGGQSSYGNPMPPKSIDDEDCYYFYYSICTKGKHCPYRHEPEAVGCEIVCSYWLQGNCNAKHCRFKHMKLTKKRHKIPCFHEDQPGGCQKDTCPFMHKSDPGYFNASDDRTVESPQSSVSFKQKNINEHKQIPSSKDRRGNFERSSKSCTNLATPQNNIPKQKRRTFDGKGIEKTIWSSQLIGDVEIAEICYDSVESLCSNEDRGCKRLHCPQHFYWQINAGGKPWMNLPLAQVSSLESSFCDPYISSFDLLPLDPSTLESSFKPLVLAMKGRTKWRADFNRMCLTTVDKSSSFVALRRLCTEFILNKPLAENKFVWYFLDKNGRWIKYGHKDSTEDADLRCNTSSKFIENNFSKKPTALLHVSSAKFKYKLNFLKMVQTNLLTKTERRMNRRVNPHLQQKNEKIYSKNQNFPLYWDPMKPADKLMRVSLSNSSQEFLDLCKFVKGLGGNFTISIIERVQNQFHYFAFQNKLKNLRAVYNKESELNIQRLFHGTDRTIVDAICNQNFDWRLHGTKVGQSYGQGTYFSNSPSYSFSYCRTDTAGARQMFIAKVIVGSMVLGNSSMVRPPLNPKTGALYDSSCDSVTKPSIIVKYEMQEYFPEYILTIG